MKKYILVLLILFVAVAAFLIIKKSSPINPPAKDNKDIIRNVDLKASQGNLLKFLRQRNDALASREIKRILSAEPENLPALWAKAEVLRRAYEFEEAEKLLHKILTTEADYAPALISLSYIKYHSSDFNGALGLLNPLLKRADLEDENQALVYMLLGSINAKRASAGGVFSKIIYGTHIRGFFEKAKSLGPDLSEVRLGLGTFYLLAPKIIGGNVDKAIEELTYAIKLAPDFATPHARLAQAYQKKGDLENYNFYLQRTEELDPENEVLREIE